MPKDLQYLSKRRKNQLINHALSCITDSHSTQVIVPNIVPIQSNAIEQAVFQKYDNTLQINQELSESFNDFDKVLETSQSDISISNDEHSVVSQENISEFTNNFDCNNQID